MRIVLAVLVLASVTPARAAHVAVHHVLDLQLDPAARALRGVDRVKLAARAPATFTLSPGFAVDRIRVDGRAIRSARTGERYSLALAGDTAHEVEIEYHATLVPPPATGELTRSVAGPEGSCLLGTGWFPSFDGPFTYEITIDVPEPQRAVTSGRLTAETTARGRSRATFESDAPLTELTLFAGPYRVVERIHRGWRLRTYFEESVADLADRYLDRVQDYLDLYDGWIGAYPYSGFAVVSGPFPVGLGFPGLTYMGTQVLRLPFIPDTSLGHEVLHSWWGNGVRTGTGGNWAEGLTTFMADYTFVERRGADAAREERLAWLRESSILPPADDPPTHRVHRTDARRVAGDRLPQGGLRLHHAPRPDRRGRVRVRGAPVLAGAPLRRRGVGRPGARVLGRVRHPARGLLRAVGAPRRRPRRSPSPASASTPPAYPSRSRRPRPRMPWRSP